jgi:hypothetical protein
MEKKYPTNKERLLSETQMELKLSQTLVNALEKVTTLDQEEKLLTLLDNIDTVSYSELRALCQKGRR